MRGGGVKDDEDDYLGDGPEVLQGRGYPASWSVSQPQQSSRAVIQGYPSSAHTPYQASEPSPSGWRQPPIRYASGQMSPYSAGYSTSNRDLTPSNRSVMGTTSHLAPHHDIQYTYPPTGYPPYQPTSQHFLPPGSQELIQPPAAGLADWQYDRAHNESDLSIGKKEKNRRDRERSASPDRGPGPNRIMSSPPSVPNFSYGA
jgi:hypothetical protein